MNIIGAGMAGLLAGHMLRRHRPIIREAQHSLPNNHSALLRFRGPGVGEASGIPFKRVTVQKGISTEPGQVRDRVTLQDANLYSKKVTGRITERSILNLDTVERWIAPDNFIMLMSSGLDIRYGDRVDANFLQAKPSEPTISTMPMPALMKLVGWPNPPQFSSRAITTATIHLPPEWGVDVYQTLYYPRAQPRMYRASLTGERLTLEYCLDKVDLEEATYDARCALRDFGIASQVDEKLVPSLRTQQHGKINPIPDRERREFIVAMTDKYNLWSVGRFATWRQIILDDVVKDIAFVDRALEVRDDYRRRIQHYNR